MSVEEVESGGELMRSSLMIQQGAAGLRYLGVDMDVVLARIGLDWDSLAKLPPRVPMSLGMRMWDAAVELTGDENLGIKLGRLVRPELYDVAGYVVRHSATLGDAIRRLTRYGRIMGEGFDLVVDIDGELATIRQPNVAGQPNHRQITEAFIVGVGVVARQLTGVEIQPLEVHLRHPPPKDPSEVRQLLEGPIHYNAPFNGFVVPVDVLSLPVLGHDDRLCEILERQAELLLRDLPDRGGFVRKVQELLTEELNGGNPNADHIASRLQISTRTLSRRLRALGTSHQRLLDQLRYELASRYLRGTDMDVSEVAFVLGFSDASALNRAFKRWAGMTPSEYRRRR